MDLIGAIGEVANTLPAAYSPQIVPQPTAHTFAAASQTAPKIAVKSKVTNSGQVLPTIDVYVY